MGHKPYSHLYKEFVPEDPPETAMGTQPLDALMTKLAITNEELVKGSTKQLTFKVVGKARRGRKINQKMQLKILESIKTLRPAEEIKLEDLFNY
jgi:hypothetical protein